MVIKDGYAVMAYDYNVVKSHTGCLFDMENQNDISRTQQFLNEQRRAGISGKDIDMS